MLTKDRFIPSEVAICMSASRLFQEFEVLRLVCLDQNSDLASLADKKAEASF